MTFLRDPKIDRSLSLSLSRVLQILARLCRRACFGVSLMASSSNDPALSLLPPEMKLALHRARLKLALSELNAALESTAPPYHDGPPPSTSHFINMTHHCSPSAHTIITSHQHPQYSPFSHHSRRREAATPNPMYVEVPNNMGKIFLGLSFQAAVAIMVFHYYQTSSSSPSSSSSLEPRQRLQHLHFVEVAIVIGSAASLVGILLQNAYPVIAGVVEKIGVVFAALGFFAMMGMFLDGFFEWIGWLVAICSLLAFIFASKKQKLTVE